jgi:hypothetical protein
MCGASRQASRWLFLVIDCRLGRDQWPNACQASSDFSVTAQTSAATLSALRSMLCVRHLAAAEGAFGVRCVAEAVKEVASQSVKSAVS